MQCEKIITRYTHARTCTHYIIIQAVEQDYTQKELYKIYNYGSYNELLLCST